MSTAMAAPTGDNVRSTSGSGANGGVAGGNNVLSDKVMRALSVRTDTPAMRAALDALSSLPADDDDDDADFATLGGGRGSGGRGMGGGGRTMIIDPRSVRAAIEKDALRRAIEFQTELRRLANDATALRARIDEVSRIAIMAGERARGAIVLTSSRTAEEDDGNAVSRLEDDERYDADGDASGGGMMGGRASAVGTATSSSSDAWEGERELAFRLAHAQRSYVEALDREMAVNSFLDKFDLGDDEARLLDVYDFVGFIYGHHDADEGEEGMEGGVGDPWNHPNAALNIVPNPSRRTMDDATAFLNALERLTVIRRELTRTFGAGGSGSEHSAIDVSFNYDNREDEDDDDDDGMGPGGGGGRGGKSIGAHSALRMMEQLATRQERAHERLYRFLQNFLGIGIAAPSSNAPSNVPTSSSDAGGLRRLPSLSSYPHFTDGALGRFRDGDEMDEAYHHPLIRRSVHVLRHSPARRSHALELVSSGRRSEVTRRFLLALTSGYGGMAPLEMKAHDPVGYVGDMLAFAFRTFRVEGELVKTLLMWHDDGDGHGDEKDGVGGGGGGGGDDDDGGDDNGGGGSSKGDGERADEIADDDDNDDQGYNKPMDAIEMLAQCMGGLARPLRTRISQVVSSLASQGPSRDDGVHGGMENRTHRANNDEQDDETSSSTLARLVALFSVCGLLRFYRSAIRMALEKSEDQRTPSVRHADNPLLVTCDECLTEAADSFVASIRAFGAMLPTHSASSSESEAQIAHRAIVRISEERIASPGFSEDVASASASTEAEDVVSKQLSLPVLVGTMIDAAMPHMRTLDDCASLKSALNVAVKCGLRASDSTKWGQLIQETERDLVESIVNAEADEVLQVCGLGGLRSSLQHMNDVYVEGMTMSSHPGLTQHDVEFSMKKFYSSLFSPPIPTFEDTIKDPEVRKIARSKTAQRVVDVYQELFDAITGNMGGYTDLAFMGHNPDQVKTLLSV